MNRSLKFLTHGLLLLFITLFCSVAKAQVYPVQVQTIMQPPYHSLLASYEQSSYEWLKVNVNFLSKNAQNNVEIKLVIEGPGVRYVTKNEGYKTILSEGVTLFTKTELAGLFDPSNLSVEPSRLQAADALPEGMYSFHFEVYEQYTGKLLSNPYAGSHMAWIAKYEPPLLVMPANGTTISSQDTCMNFLWTPRAINVNGSAVRYSLEIIEVLDVNTPDPFNVGVQGREPVSQTPITSYNLCTSVEALVRDSWYAFRVKVEDLNNVMKFRNYGYSEVKYFYYGSPCGVPANFSVEEFNEGTVKPHWDEDALNSYDLEYREAGRVFASWDVIESAESDFEYSGFDQGKTYEFRLKQNCAKNSSDYTDVVEVAMSGVDYTQCAAPTLFTAERVRREGNKGDDEFIEITWYPVDVAEKYRLKLSDGRVSEYDETVSRSVSFKTSANGIHGDTLSVKIDVYCFDTWVEGVEYPIYLTEDVFVGGNCQLTYEPQLQVTPYQFGLSKVSWYDDPKYAKYVFKWRKLGASDDVEYQEITTEDATAEIYGCEFGQLYEYQIEYYCANGDVLDGTANVFMLALTTPEVVERTGDCYPPAGFRYHLYDTLDLDFVWEAEDDVRKYEFQWKLENDTVWKSVQTRKEFYSFAVENGKRYISRIRSMCGAGKGYSRWSDDISVTIDSAAQRTPDFYCQVPEYAEPVFINSSEVKLMMTKDSAHSAFVAEYRKFGTEIWQPVHSGSSFTLFKELQAETAYEFRVKAYCGSVSSAYSDIDGFVTPEYTAERETEECGVDSAYSLPSGGNAELAAGDRFSAAGWMLTVEEITGDTAGYTGTAYAIIPYMNDSKGVFTLTDVTVKEDGDGNKIMVGDPASAALSHVTIQLVPESIRNQVNNMLDQVESGLNTALEVAELVEHVEKELENLDQVFATPDLSKYAHLSPQEKLQKAYELLEEGADMISNGALAEGGATVHEGKALLELALSQGAKDVFAPSSPALLADAVFFSASASQVYGFDNQRYDANIEQFYYVKMADGDYYMPFKSVVEGDGDYVDVLLPDSMRFNEQTPLTGEDVIRFYADDTEIFATAQTEVNGRKKGTLQFDAGTDEITAKAIRTIDGEETEVLLGQVKVQEYEEKNYRLHIIKVKESPGDALSLNVDDSDISAKLNAIFKQAGAQWTVRNETDLIVDGLSGLDFDISNMDEGYMPDSYTSGMEALIEEFGADGADDDFYLFVLDDVASTVEYDGFMPVGKNSAFIVLDKIGSEAKIPYVVAHEMGHGAFTLRHTFGKENQYLFAKAETSNLMDYNSNVPYDSKIDLFKYQWDQIENPDWFVWTSGGAEAASEALSNLTCVGNDVIDATFDSYLQNNVFLLPTKKPQAIDLEGARPLTFFNEHEVSAYLRGTLAAFKKDGEVYWAKYDQFSGDFIGYAPLGVDDYIAFDSTKHDIKLANVTDAHYLKFADEGEYELRFGIGVNHTGTISDYTCPDKPERIVRHDPSAFVFSEQTELQVYDDAGDSLTEFLSSNITAMLIPDGRPVRMGADSDMLDVFARDYITSFEWYVDGGANVRYVSLFAASKYKRNAFFKFVTESHANSLKQLGRPITLADVDSAECFNDEDFAYLEDYDYGERIYRVKENAETDCGRLEYINHVAPKYNLSSFANAKPVGNGEGTCSYADWAIQFYALLDKNDAYVYTVDDQEELASLLKQAPYLNEDISLVLGSYLSNEYRIKALRVLSAFDMLGGWFGFGSDEEGGVKNIFENVPDSEVKEFLELLETEKAIWNPNNRNLMYRIVQGIDGDNYADLMKIIIDKIKRCPDFLNERLAEATLPTEFDKRALVWELGDSDDIERNVGYVRIKPSVMSGFITHKIDGTIEVQNQRVTGFETEDDCVTGWRSVADCQIPVWADNDVLKLRPFDLVFLHTDAHMSEIKEMVAGQAFLPAIVLKYANDKVFNKNAADFADYVMDAATLIGSGGTLTAVKNLTKLRKAWIAYEIITSTSNILINAMDLDEIDEYKTAVDAFNIIQMASGVSEIGYDIAKNRKAIVAAVASAPRDVLSRTSNVTEQVMSNCIQAIERLAQKSKSGLKNAEKNGAAFDELLQFADKMKKDWRKIYGHAYSGTRVVVTALKPLYQKTYNWLGQFAETVSGSSSKIELKFGSKKIGEIDGDVLRLTDVDAELPANIASVEGVIEDGVFKLGDGTVDITDDLLIAKDNDGIYYCVRGAKACFVAGTKVKTAAGFETIENIRAGETVWAFDEKSNSMTWSKVKSAFSKKAAKLVRMVTSADTILATPEHPFFTKEGWKNIGKLNVGAKVKLAAGIWTAILSIQSFDTLATVYNFEVEGSHTYTVGSSSLIVHNDCSDANYLSSINYAPDKLDDLVKNPTQLKKVADFMRGTVNLDGLQAWLKSGLPDDIFNKIEAFSETRLIDLNTDLLASAQFQDKLNQVPDLVDSWTHVYNARGAAAVWKTDVVLLEKLAAVKTNTGFMTHVGGNEGLEAILTANVRAGCKSCGDAGEAFLKPIDGYLDDVEDFVSNYNGNEGFADVLAELKRTNANGSANYAMEGAAFMIDRLRRTPEITPASVKRFDGVFEIDPDEILACVNCRFDIELNSGVKYEYKSYGEVSVRKIGGITSTDQTFLKQHLSYLQDASSIDNIKYEFDLRKLSGSYLVDGVDMSGIEFVRSQFKKMYISNAEEIIDLMSPALRSELNILETATSFTDAQINMLFDKIIRLN